MRLRHRPADPVRVVARQHPRPEGISRVVRFLALPMVLPMALALSACGGEEEDTQSDDPNAEAAATLHEAQPLHFRDATLIPEGSESGTYSELVTVQYSEEVRDATELDKPECVDAVNRWGELDSVRGAPASVAAYEWEEGSVSHMLVRLEESDAAEAFATRAPDSCAEYNATYEDGSSFGYGINDLDLARVGDESRAFSVEVRSDGDDSDMFTVVYRNGGLLGATSIIGPGGSEDYEDMLVEFSEAAVERQRQTLG